MITGVVTTVTRFSIDEAKSVSCKASYKNTVTTVTKAAA
jgi:hypothetical protein